MSPAVHPFSYLVSRRDKGSPPPFPLTRDDGASLELLPLLLSEGFGLGETIVNTPPEAAPARHLEEHELLDLDLSFVEPGDLLLWVTRPPIHDFALGCKKKIEPANNRTERALFTLWQRYLAECARSQVRLAPEFVPYLRSGFENRRNIEFRQHNDCFYRQLNGNDGRGFQPPEAGERTAAFFLRVSEAWQGGPGLVAAWGMDALATRIWAYRLRHDYSWLLDAPRFAMVEMEYGHVPRHATNLRFSRDFQIEIALDAPL